MKEKLKKVKRRIRLKRNELLLLISEPNIRYLTDQYKLNCIITITNKTKPFIVTSVSGKERLSKSKFEVFSFSDKNKADIKAKDYLQALKKIIKMKKLKVKSVSYEKNILPYRIFEKITKSFRCKTNNISNEMFEVRSVKTKEEIRRINIASLVISKTMRKFESNIRPGITERELAAIAEQEMRKKADWFSFETLVSSGSNSASIHHIPTNRKIKKKDLIMIDCGIIYKNYCSDITRTFCLNPSKKTKKIYNIVLKSQKNVLKKIKPNIKAKILHDTAKKIIEDGGYQLPHAVGHGVGIQIHEQPNIIPNSELRLKPNMIFTVEPGIYLKGFGGVRIEDTVLLTKKGIKLLTKYPRNLI